MNNKLVQTENLILRQRDKLLVRQTLNGNSKAFTHLVAANKKRIDIIGYKFFHNESDVEDFVQEVFIKAYNNLSYFKGESRFSTWLTSIAYTTAINIKNRKKEVDFFEENQEESIPSKYESPENNQIKEATRIAINEAIKDLPESYATCINMFFYLDMNQEDISEATGIPLNTVKSNIFRAKKILSEKLRGLV